MKAKIYQPTPANLRRLGNALQLGELVAIPTETVYGLAANALSTNACRKIFKAKQRPTNDPLIVHVLDLKHAEELAEFGPAAKKLAAKFWPGPLTLVLRKKKCVPAIVTSGGNTVAIRSPAHPIARRLLTAAKIPLAAPSANSFGYISPTEASHVSDGLGSRIKHILDGGASELGVESTILDITNEQHPVILRPGTISAAALQKCLKVPITEARRSVKSDDNQRQRAPGMLSRHYSPRTPLEFSSGANITTSPQVGRIFIRKPKGKPGQNTYWLSERGSLQQIAHNLYRVLRQADAAGHEKIIIEPLPAGSGALAVAINDRLRRAAAKR